MATESNYHRLRGQESPASSRYVPQQGLARYKPALQTLLPIRTSFQPSTGQTMTLPLEEVGFFSYVTFHWLSSILWTTYRTRISEMFLPQADSCDINGLRLENMWMDSTVRRGQLKASMGSVAFRFVRTRLIVSSIIQIIAVMIALGAPWMIVNYYLVYSEPTLFDRMIAAFTMIGIELTASFFKAWSTSIASRTAGRLRSAYLAMTYKKLIKLADPGPSGHSSQKLLQDAATIHSAVLYGPHVVTAPIVMLACIALMAPGHKLPVFIASSFLITLLLLWLLVSLAGLLSSRAASFSSLRHARLQELLENFKLVKMTVCDKIFSASIAGLHRLELSYLVRAFFCDSVSESILQAMPLIAAILLFCKMDHIPLHDNMLVIILLFTHVKDSMFRFWYGFRSLTEALTALSHLKEVLVLEDGESFKEREKPIAKEVAVSITNASFTRRNRKPIRIQRKFRKKKVEDLGIGMEQMPELVDIEMQIDKGMLVGLVGPGGGASALLLAVLGQLPTSRGFMMRAGRCAYVAGTAPWIMSRADIRENVTLSRGGALRQQRYYKALHDCCLHEELAALPQDDSTVAGDVVMSRSMAQRIALARALYCADCDIYLLDEPLSAVGQMTSVDVFNRSILMGLRDKTVFLATRNIQFLSRCNEIFVIEGGRVIEQGTHEQLLADDFKYASLVNPHRSPFLEADPEPMSPRPTSTDGPKGLFSAPPGPFIASASPFGPTPEVSDVLCAPPCWLAATLTILALSVAVFCTSIVLLMVNVISTGETASDAYKSSTTQPTMTSTEQVSSNGTASTWDGASPTEASLVAKISAWDTLFEDIKEKSLLGVIAITFGSGAILLGLVWRLFLMQTSKRVSKRSHSDWLARLIATSTASLSTASDTQNVLQCFFQHTLLMSRSVPMATGMCVENIAMLFGFATLFLFKIWSFIPLALFYATSVLFVAIYRGSAAQINAMEIAKQREFQEFVQSTVKGRTTIQSLSKHREFFTQFCTLCDAHATSFYLLHAASRWVTIRIQFLAVIFVGGVWFVSNNHPAADDAFLFAVLLAAWQLGGYTRRAVRASVEAESGGHALKACHGHLQDLGSEVQDWTIEPVRDIRDGSVVFDDVHTAASLNGVSFNVHPGHSCGVIGSSRSAVISALFRLSPLTNGAIWLGGEDIASMPLEDYRRRLALIPLGAPLVSPSARDFREFLDPDSKLEVRQIQEVLRGVGLADKYTQLDLRLPGSLTLEERESLWLARAVIAQPWLVVLEESCYVTPARVREFLPYCTVLSVSGQLPPGALANCDYTVAVSDGKVSEFSEPMNLADFNSSHGSEMVGSSMATLFETQL